MLGGDTQGGGTENMNCKLCLSLWRTRQKSKDIKNGCDLLQIVDFIWFRKCLSFHSLSGYFVEDIAVIFKFQCRIYPFSSQLLAPAYFRPYPQNNYTNEIENKVWKLIIVRDIFSLIHTSWPEFILPWAKRPFRVNSYGFPNAWRALTQNPILY